eukprot:TRINITY_DN1415_c0_g1_i4.p1 TRINITY_DN1415_c0_g1~~TRINITY_DN1415_c0_g1_i4.p1  ORF type:complete len:187 (+),score=36.82 TRINITY_DN1415_c0_g1_i4:184-744(+)
MVIQTQFQKSCKWCEQGSCWGCKTNPKGAGKGKVGAGGSSKGGSSWGGKGGGGGSGGQWVDQNTLNMITQLLGSQMGGKGGKGKGKKGATGWKLTLDKIAKLEPEKKIYVSGLPSDCDWKKLSSHFETHGFKPVLAEMMGRENGVAVVTYKTAEETTAAMMAMDGTSCDGNMIHCEGWTKAEPKAK